MDLVTVDKRRLTFDLSPSNLVDAQPPTTTYISESLTVTNIVSQTLAFKVKTNNQDRYIVRPNVGLIHPNNQITITISFHPSATLPSSDQSTKDKFLLRIAPILPHQFDALSQFWQESETDPIVRGLKFHVDFIHNQEQSLNSPLLPSQKFHEQHLIHQEKEKENLLQEHQQQPTVPHERDLPPDLFPNTNIDPIMRTANTFSPEKKDSVKDNSISQAHQQQHQQFEENMNQQEQQQRIEQNQQLEEEHQRQQVIPDSSTYEEAIARLTQLQTLLDEKNLELSRLKTELAETRAQTERVLKDAPVTPISANSFLTDPFGGFSPLNIALFVVLIAVMITFILRS